jgi:uncharacterized membrane protein (UPF0182 family)
MSRKPPPIELDDQVIDIEPSRPPRRRRGKLFVILAVILLLFLLMRGLSIYLEALWFGSLGYASVYWYTFRLKLILFAIFFILTVLILRGAFWLLERSLAAAALEPRVITINNQPLAINPARIMRPLTWAIALLFGLIYGLGMSDAWEPFALYLNQPSTGLPDPIFQKPLGFYLFTLPVHQLLSSWLAVLAFIILSASILYALLSLPQKSRTSIQDVSRRDVYRTISFALAIMMVALAWIVYLARYPYLWNDHQSFSGITYTEANYFLPGLLIVCITLLVGALISLVNAFTRRRLLFLIIALALPVAVFIVAGILVPSYVHSFIVKPNELARETPYIEHNLAWTRRAYGLDKVETRDFAAETSASAFSLETNRSTLDNIRLWDKYALHETLEQVQAIRNYYDFTEVDVDRYMVSGQMRQMMLAARELDITKIPEQSRNWVNERLIYTHGYGVTMNTANGFTLEGKPLFVLSNMPIESSAPEIKVTRPQIYFGQKTNTDVYVKTRQKEFDFPQGEANTYTVYEGTGGIPISGTFSRMLIAWALGDLSKLPFSDDITSESRVLMRRNIEQRVRTIAPFLIYDSDPYIVVTGDGRLVWMIDAFTETSNYPYSRHYYADNQRLNYIRNSVKVTIDAYDGAVVFYVFDATDPLINAYRATFPALFRDASQMPADLRAHIRYPDTLIKAQGEAYGLYHTQNPKIFFQREDVWSVARMSHMNQGKQETSAIEPYYVLVQLPGEESGLEFVDILPFTPGNRNNMIGWMAGRSDGAAYSSLLAYNFPQSRLVDGPLQIEARIDQDAQLSSQLTLWNQQGSSVIRGNMLVIPINRGLLYVEPIYLKAQRSPMPELRLVVLATQERLAYGANFEEAMTSLFGKEAATAATAPAKETEDKGKPQPTESKSPETSTATLQPNVQQLITRAAQDLSDYQRLTAEGKHGEAGQKLESLKRNLDELKKAQGKQ